MVVSDSVMSEDVITCVCCQANVCVVMVTCVLPR